MSISSLIFHCLYLFYYMYLFHCLYLFYYVYLFHYLYLLHQLYLAHNFCPFLLFIPILIPIFIFNPLHILPKFHTQGKLKQSLSQTFHTYFLAPQKKTTELLGMQSFHVNHRSTPICIWQLSDCNILLRLKLTTWDICMHKKVRKILFLSVLEDTSSEISAPSRFPQIG